jgi:hypothetical protein
VGGLRCLLPLCFLDKGDIVDKVGSSPLVDTAVLNGRPCEPGGVRFSMILDRDIKVMRQSIKQR